MSDEAKHPPTRTILLVYCGSRIGVKEKLIDLWLLVTPEQLEAGEVPTDDERHQAYRVYGKLAKKHMSGSPGSVYEVQETIDEKASIYPTDSRYKGLWPNDDDRARWQVAHRTAKTTMDLRKQKAKDASQDNLAFLRPVRQKYAKLVSQDQKAALLAQVIAYITAGDI